MRAASLLLALIAFGCGRKSATGGGADETPQVREYRAAAAHYLEQTRVKAQLLAQRPSAAQAAKLRDEVADLFRRLPPGPPELDPHGGLTQMLGNARMLFDEGADWAGKAEEALRGGRPDEARTIYDQHLTELAENAVGHADAVEEFLRPRRE